MNGVSAWQSNNVCRNNEHSFGRIAFIGNYLPRQCGIATFTTHLCEAIAAQHPEIACIALPVSFIGFSPFVVLDEYFSQSIPEPLGTIICCCQLQFLPPTQIQKMPDIRLTAQKLLRQQ